MQVWVGALLAPLGIDSIEMPGGSVLSRQDIERVSTDPEARNVVPAAAEALRATGNCLNTLLAQGTVHLGATRNVRLATKRSYTDALAPARARLGRLQLQDITKADVDD